MSLSSALKAGLGSRLKDLSGTGDGADWDPFTEGPRQNDKEAAAPVPKKAVPAAKKQALRADRAEAVTAPAPVARSKRPANANLSDLASAPSTPATKPTGQTRRNTAWLQEKGQGTRVNPQQYARELDRYMNEQNRRLTQETVMEVAAGELEGIAQMAAKARGRYFAKLLDAGAPRHGFLQEAEVAELKFYREMFEEMTRGFESMRDAIEAGDLSVSGMSKRR